MNRAKIESGIAMFFSLFLLLLDYSASHDYPQTPIERVIEEYRVYGISPPTNPWWVNFIQTNDSLIFLLILGGIIYACYHWSHIYKSNSN
jgi:hypothetical protein